MLWRAVVRTDPEQGESIRKSKALEQSAVAAARDLRTEGWGKDSLSGKERNRLFLNLKGHQFADVSMISGADDKADGRSVAVWDYDRDGWSDLVVVNANAPRLGIFHNQVSKILTGSGQPGNRRGVIAFKFIGGNSKAMASSEWSNRDGYGVRLEVGLKDGTVLLREHRCGEGFATQNSEIILMGIGEQSGVERVLVNSPSGKVQELGKINAGKLIHLYENPAESPPTMQIYSSGTTK